MRTPRNLLSATLLSLATLSVAQPIVDSWYTEQAGRYARIYQTTADESARNAVTTWSRGQGVQDQPTYAGVNEVSVTDTHVYIRTTGLGFHVMGPWYLNENQTNDFPNFPSNQAVIYQLPLAPETPPSTKTPTGLGAIGYFVDGIAMFDSRDAFSYSTANGTDATPRNGIQGDDVWNRDAYVNESVTFDAANAHQAGGNHHYHANPPALRHLLGGAVSYDESTNTYTEQIGGNGKHSPILGWVRDGLPLYGPYGYSDPMDPASSIRKMVTGYQKRDGTNGSTNLSSTGRTTLPQWMIRNDSTVSTTTLAANRYGPAVNTTYTLGHYLEDYAYKGDLAGLSLYDGTGSFNPDTHYDLNEYNVRYCVTPEFPEGTWAYFTCIQDDGTPQFPYNISRYYFGNPTGDRSNSIPAEAAIVFQGGPEAPPQVNSFAVDTQNDTVTLTWTGAEGGSYVIRESNDLKEWIQISNPVAVDANQTATTTETASFTNNDSLFYRVEFSSAANFDDSGFDLTTPSTQNPAPDAQTFSITFPTTPPLPPQDAITITVDSATATIVSYNQSTGAAEIQIDTTLLNPGSYNASFTFTPPNSSETTITSTNQITIEESTARNILLLIVDDWGIDFSPFDNALPSATLPNLPNMQTLADSGIHFSNAYAQPLCSPTRASILTGRHPFRNGVGNPGDNSTLAAEETALPELLAAQGAPHGLASFGKWHLGGGRNGAAERGGWQKFAGIQQGGVAAYDDWTKFEDGVRTDNVTTYSTTDQVNEAVEYIQSQADNPWFVWMAFNAPHTPFHDPAPYVTPEGGYSTNGTTNTDLYIKALEALDSEIGRLLESVDLEKTNIILIGDNGTPNQVAQAPFGDGHAKGDLYEGGIHVPMLAAGPDITATPGSTEDTFVHCIDLFATILDLADLDIASATASLTIDSQNLTPLFRGQDLPERHIVSEMFGHDSGNGRALRSETHPDYKLIIFGDKDSQEDTPTFEFYNIATDQNEQSPLNIDTLTGAALDAYNHLRQIDTTLGGGYSTPAS
ncbi:sulfatase-like hydrolase/transferase [Pelagicoccus mobilis]|uniref:Sulfatase-like hydrolase/transferase n=1 Tax=Pelagicoccus mobilis TaxID=415221 RepID=A0A934S4F7_9BACT|nr:sulfatase-like hydrolase/transferase [Pelagicoccus mobilis]MBK1880561.1 sulfatase-like hydrolase/transferase [Pelagicoccus mobilis]